MKFIRPVTVTDSMLVSSIAENDYPVWSAATSYTVGTRVMRASTHRIYECLVAGSDATAPEAAPTRWLNVGPTNRWAAFDSAVGSKTTASGSITLSITPGQRVDSLALLDVLATSVTVTMALGAQALYTRTIVLADTVEPVVDWYSYWQAEFTRTSTVLITDMPRSFSGADITVALQSAAGGTVELGTLALGSGFEIGNSQYGVQTGITDYSVSITDAFGVTTVVERSYAKRMTLSVEVPASRYDTVAAMLAAYRARPVVWVGVPDGPESTVIYGYAKDWSGQISYPTRTIYNLEIRGIT